MPRQFIRYEFAGHQFELAVEADLVRPYRRSTDGAVALDDVVLSDTIFSDGKRGDRASDESIAALGSNPLDTILRKGEIPLTTAERRVLVEQQRKAIVSYIHRYYVQPSTRMPAPVTRIENALALVKPLRIEPFCSPAEEAAALVKRMESSLLLIKQEVEAVLTVPYAHLGTAQGIIKRLANVRSGSEKHSATGATMTLSVAPGDYEALLAELNSKCQGEIDFSVVGAANASTEPSPAPSSAKSGRSGKGKGKRGR
jgi:ribosome maturation protein SDO1